MMNVGGVYRFDYNQGNENVNRLGRVVAVRDLTESPLSRKSIKANPAIERSRFLLTVALADGTVKNFYNHAVSHVRPVGLLERIKIRLIENRKV